MRRVLYLGDLHPHATSRHRMEAMRRLGLEVEGVDIRPSLVAGNRLMRAFRLRAQMGVVADRLNRQVLERGAAFAPDVVWLDKPLLVRPSTILTLRQRGALTVLSTSDNPFISGHPVGMWRQFKRSIPLVDVNLVPRPSGFDDYARAGSRLTLPMAMPFDPVLHFPRRGGEKTVPLAFIGSPHDRRADFLARMVALGQPVQVSGPHWPRRSDLPVAGAGHWGDDYRHAIWRTGVCMAFVTHMCKDTYGHKSLEITACGTALLAERHGEHPRMFVEDVEAALFSSPEEAVEKARWLAAHPDARERMALAGCRRMWNSGLSNDECLAGILARIDPAAGAPLVETARAFIARRRDELGL